MNIFAKIEKFYDDLSLRERKMIVVAGILSIIFIASVMIFLISDSFEKKRTRIEELKKAISLLRRNRGKVQETKELMASYEMKAIRKPPMLQGHLDNMSKKFDLKASNFIPKKSENLGENDEYHKESVQIEFHDVTLKKVSRFMQSLESSRFLIMVTELTISPRRGQHDRLDQEMTVSSYHKKSSTELKRKSKEKKKKTKD
ncbi:MAG: type II secretion system protein GspM [Myxococcota bacterium]